MRAFREQQQLCTFEHWQPICSDSKRPLFMLAVHKEGGDLQLAIDSPRPRLIFKRSWACSANSNSQSESLGPLVVSISGTKQRL
jgi:hypothetical protein